MVWIIANIVWFSLVIFYKIATDSLKTHTLKNKYTLALYIYISKKAFLYLHFCYKTHTLLDFCVIIYIV